MSGDSGDGFWNTIKTRLNPWHEEQKVRADRNVQRDTNQIVHNTTQKTSDLKKKHRFLRKKAEKLKSTAMAPQTSERERIRIIDEYKQLQGQITQLEKLLKTIYGVSVAIDTTATNVQVFDVMKDAQAGMETMMNQVNVNDIDHTMTRLQRNIDSGQVMNRAMTQELDWGDGDAYDSHQQSQSSQASRDLLAEWRSEEQASDMPSIPVTQEQPLVHSNNITDDPVVGDDTVSHAGRAATGTTRDNV